MATQCDSNHPFRLQLRAPLLRVTSKDSLFTDFWQEQPTESGLLLKVNIDSFENRKALKLGNVDIFGNFKLSPVQD